MYSMCFQCLYILSRKQLDLATNQSSCVFFSANFFRTSLAHIKTLDPSRFVYASAVRDIEAFKKRVVKNCCVQTSEEIFCYIQT